MTEAAPPRVFISYSHDTPDHKKWVAKLAAELVNNGVEVILDQWDLAFGDDVPKFMEKGVKDSDRVLMICSTHYVKKADDGSGGVGYEAMIVTGELVNNLGTSKFIPIVRQSSEQRLLPKSMSTRFYVDLSEDNEEQFEQLIRELHKSPAVIKPPLGQNPFAKSPSGGEIQAGAAPDVPKSDLIDPIVAYQTARAIVKADDILKWREIVRAARHPISDALAEWRKANESTVSTDEELIAKSLRGIDVFSPLICVAIAGIGSGRQRYSNQIALFEEILQPKEWNRSGLTSIVYLPEAAAFVYQSVHGAMCAYTDQIMNSMEFIRSFIQLPNLSKPVQICRNYEIMGWPSSLGRNSDTCWRTLYSLPNEYAWLIEIFGDLEEFQTAVVAYYMALNINEYCILLTENLESHLDGEMSMGIPLGFLTAPEDTQRRAYRLLLQDKEGLQNIWLSLGIDDKRFFTYWGKWIELCSRWLARSGPWGLRSGIAHKDLNREFGHN